MNVPGGEERDESDYARLRHARDQDLGFAVGKYRQPAPMLFTRDGHNIYLGDMYRGHTAFLVCGGPSLTSHDLSQLQRRGIVSLALNNAAIVHRPQLWCSVDDPGNFCDAIWYDPGILKFVPLCHMEKRFMVRDQHEQLVPSKHAVGDMPGVFGYRRNESFVAEQWLYEDTFNWGNHGNRTDAYGIRGSRSVMYIALRLLFYLGFRRVYLLGCDFRMEQGKQNYAFAQDRSSSSIRGNNDSYRVLNKRLEVLQPYFEKESFEIYNCTPDSGLTVFPHASFEEAVEYATSIIPKTIITKGMYDRQARARGQRRAPRANGRPRPAPIEETPVDSETFKNYPDTTLVTWVDEETKDALCLTWRTWMRFKPWLRDIPVLVLHPGEFDAEGDEDLRPLLSEHARLACASFQVHRDTSMREQLAYQLVRIPAEQVKTPWYLKLDPQTIAPGLADWVMLDWFKPNDEGRPPVLISHNWSYTKPADTLTRLDDWGDTVDGLREKPRLDLPFSPADSRILHDTISSWCFFGDTEWTREVLKYVPDRLPCPAHDTFMNYCAVRRGDHIVRLHLKDFGWEHNFSAGHGLRRRCRELLGDA